jgi:predicted transcriptional regulator
MSIALMTRVWGARTGLSSVQKMVLLKLADCANDGGHAWPSIPTISAAVECSQRTVIRALAELESAGYIMVNRRRSSGGQRRNLYIIQVSECHQEGDRMSPGPSDIHDKPGDKSGIHQVTPVSLKRSKNIHEPTFVESAGNTENTQTQTTQPVHASPTSIAAGLYDLHRGRLRGHRDHIIPALAACLDLADHEQISDAILSAYRDQRAALWPDRLAEIVQAHVAAAAPPPIDEHQAYGLPWLGASA